MTEQNSGGTSGADALDMAVGIAVAAAIVNDAPDKPLDPASLPPNCLNCGAPVGGRYCFDCGQVTDTHVPTLREVCGDAIVSLFNLDSRLWRTLGALFFHPGRLTQDFLAGKRARYVPPLRLYLVLSVLLFLILSLKPDNDDDDDVAADINASITRNLNEPSRAVADALQNVPAEELPDDVDFEFDESGLNITNADGSTSRIDDGQGCEQLDVPFSDRGDPFDTEVREACERNVANDFEGLGEAFLDNIPLLAFLVIPVMAAVFRIFYVFTGLPYLQHLIFLCHTHAFTFLLFMVWNLLLILDDFVPMAGWLTGLWVVIIVFYSPTYYFLAMRRAYGQGMLLTLVKLPLLMVAYMIVTTLIFTLGFLVVMLTN